MLSVAIDGLHRPSGSFVCGLCAAQAPLQGRWLRESERASCFDGAESMIGAWVVSALQMPLLAQHSYD